jgi:hypothetical protein
MGGDHGLALQESPPTPLMKVRPWSPWSVDLWVWAFLDHAPNGGSQLVNKSFHAETGPRTV